MNAMCFESGGRIPVRFCEGDTVDVLNAARLPQVEEVRHKGKVTRVQAMPDGETLYWIQGVSCARSARVLRLVRRAR